VKLREKITLQKAQLNLEDLHFILNEIQGEIHFRTTAVLEMIPSMLR
jgi:hypothetical protein